MTMTSEYGSAIYKWTTECPDEGKKTLEAEIEAILIDAQAKGATISINPLMQRLIRYEDSRLEYLDACSWGGSRLVKCIKPEYRAAFDEWWHSKGRVAFTHSDSCYLSCGGYTKDGEMFITIDPKNHPPS